LLIKNKKFDVIVVGAGPAGSSAASFLADRGINVLIIEKDSFPRDKPCGGCLSLKILKFLPCLPDHIVKGRIFGAKFTYKNKAPFFINSEEVIGYLVKRELLDSFLVKDAIDKGAILHQGERIISIERKNKEMLFITDKGKRYSADFGICADGARSIGHKILNPNYHLKFYLAIDGKINVRPEDVGWDSRLIQLDFGGIPHGYRWIFPKEDHFSVGIGQTGGRKKRKMAEDLKKFLSHFPFLIKFPLALKGYPLPAFSANPLRLAGERLLLVGDAAQLVDPFIGEGIFYALISGRIAAEAIEIGLKSGRSIEDLYIKRIDDIILNDMKLAHKIANVIYRFPKISFNIMKRNQDIGRFYLDILAGKTGYKAFFRYLKEKAFLFLKKA